MTPDKFKTNGRALFGYGWQTRLAERLQRNVQTIRKWQRGTSPIPREIDLLFGLWLKHGTD